MRRRHEERLAEQRRGDADFSGGTASDEDADATSTDAGDGSPGGPGGGGDGGDGGGE